MKIQVSLSDDALGLVRMMTQQMTHMTRDIREVTVGTKIHQRSKQKDCFNNAWRHIDDNPGDVYVLGYVFVHGIPLEHAWVRHGKQYYDVTLDAAKQELYVAVTEVPAKALMHFVFKNGHAPDMYGYEVALRNRK